MAATIWWDCCYKDSCCKRCWCNEHTITVVTISDALLSTTAAVTATSMTSALKAAPPVVAEISATEATDTTSFVNHNTDAAIATATTAMDDISTMESSSCNDPYSETCEEHCQANPGSPPLATAQKNDTCPAVGRLARRLGWEQDRLCNKHHIPCSWVYLCKFAHM